MTNILYIEAFSGASGDMFLSALAGLTDSYDELLNIPSMLNFADQAEIKIEDIFKAFARAIRMGIKKIDDLLPSTKGVL